MNDKLNFEEYYGNKLKKLDAARRQVSLLLEECPIAGGVCLDEDEKALIYIKSRIKSPKSMMNKMERKGLPIDSKTALLNTHDAVGVRGVCAFTDDVKRIAQWVSGIKELTVKEVRDYITHPKPNGYRSYHMILKINTGPGKGETVELQLRTLAIDFWASLEHQIKYKRSVPHEKLIREELKHCADEIASVDLSMQTINQLLNDDF